MRKPCVNLEKRKQLIEMLKIDWVSILTIEKMFNVSSQRALGIIDSLYDYPIAEEIRKNITYYKIMNRSDYE